MNQKTRLRILVRDNFQCQAERFGLPDTARCYHDHRYRALRLLTIHHIVPRCQGGTSDPDNLATLCVEHHPMMHR